MSINKKTLIKGIQYISGALPLAFMGLVVINSSFKNQENPYYEVILGLGILFCALAIFLMFKGCKNNVIKVYLMEISNIYLISVKKQMFIIKQLLKKQLIN